MSLRYGSVCSGIEAATVAWHPLGWRAAWFAEVEPFPCAVLAHHYPDTPNLGDITKITEDQLASAGRIDVLVGGTPCQSFSVAGLRKGLADPRGNLALRFVQLAGVLRPRWVVWENVPGVLSSEGGRDFGTFLGALAELGYGFAYRVLDAQYVGVPQRRRRVFVVGHLGDWRRAAAVLFERHSLSGNPPPSREAGAGAPLSLTERTRNGERQCEWQSDVAYALDNPGEGGRAQTRLVAHSITPILEAGKRCGTRNDARDGLGVGQPGDPMFTLQRGAQHAIAFDTTQITSDQNYSNPRPGDPCHPLASGAHPPAVALQMNFIRETRIGDYTGSLQANPGDSQFNGVWDLRMGVRRLTPRECERLQGFPDQYTLVPYRGKPAADGPRYKALGNSMAVPCMRWLGERIALVDELPSPAGVEALASTDPVN